MAFKIQYIEGFHPHTIACHTYSAALFQLHRRPEARLEVASVAFDTTNAVDMWCIAGLLMSFSKAVFAPTGGHANMARGRSQQRFAFLNPD